MASNLFDDAHGLGSEFSDCNSEVELAQRKKKQEKEALLKKPNVGRVGIFVSGSSSCQKPSKHVAHDLKDVEEAKRMRYHGLLAMDAYTRHKKMVNDYLFLYGGKLSDFKRDSSKDRTDYDVIKENHQFLWDQYDDDDEISWEKRLAKKYWNKLYKEYTICDLTRYKEKKIAFRWRVEKEVVSGKGQFVCANKRCSEKESLRSWEVNFSYVEVGEKKNALVKCRLCPDCSYKLNYHHKKRDVTGLKKSKKTKNDKSLHETQKKKSKTSSSEQASTSDDNEGTKKQEHQIWSQPLQLENEKSREEEFEDYFEGLFL